MIKSFRINTSYRITWPLSAVILLAALLLETLTFFHLSAFDLPFPLGNDNARLSLPLRAVISDSIQNGHFPWWNPYSGGGVPAHTLYTSQGLSPIVLALSLLGHYDTTLFITEAITLNAIAFVGAYFFTRQYCSRLPSYIAAFSYALTPFMTIQSLLNIEAVGSASALPWIMLGAKLIIESRLLGVVIFPAGLGLAFTSGYLGLNYLNLCFLLLFFFILFIVTHIKIIYFSDRCHTPYLKLIIPTKIYYISFSATLIFLSLISPLIYETFRNFDTGFFTKRSINPFEVSVQLKSVLSILDTKGIAPFEPDEYGGHLILLFVPSIMLFGLFQSILKPTALVITLWITLTLIFTSALSEQYFLARLIVMLIPGFDAIRLHSWLASTIIFLILMLGAIGLSQASSLSKATSTALGATTLCYTALIAIYFMSQPAELIRDKFFWLSTVFCSALSIALLFALRKVANIEMKVVLGLALLTISISQIFVASTRWDRGTLYARLLPNTLQKDAYLLYKQRDTTIHSLQSLRGLHSSSAEAPYLLKSPVVDSYMPQRNPSFTSLIEQNRGGLLSSYTLDLASVPIPSQAHWITTDQLELTFTSAPQTAAFLVSIPFSHNWQATSGERTFSVVKGEFNFLRIEIDTPLDRIQLTYKTSFSNILLGYSTLCWLLIFFTCIVFAIRHTWDLTRSVRNKSVF